MEIDSEPFIRTFSDNYLTLILFPFGFRKDRLNAKDIVGEVSIDIDGVQTTVNARVQGWCNQVELTADNLCYRMPVNVFMQKLTHPLPLNLRFRKQAQA
jgi:hypothetical protein